MDVRDDRTRAWRSLCARRTRFTFLEPDRGLQASGPDPAIAAIQPSSQSMTRGSPTQLVVLQVRGSNFAERAAVRLRREVEPKTISDFLATVRGIPRRTPEGNLEVEVLVDPDNSSGDDGSDVAYHVSVVNPDGGTATVERGFVVQTRPPPG